MAHKCTVATRTSVVPSNSSLHNRLHPIPNDSLLVRAEILRLVMLVVDPEPISAGVHILVHCDFIPSNIGVSFDLRLLKGMRYHQRLPAHEKTETYSLAGTLQAVHVMAFQHEIPQFPGIIPISLFPHPAGMIRLADLL